MEAKFGDGNRERKVGGAAGRFGKKDENNGTNSQVQQAVHLHYVLAGPGGTAFYVPSLVEESVKKAQQQIAKALLTRASDMCKDKMNIEVETLVFEGDPKEKICRGAQEMHVDLLVVGSRNLGKFKRAFLGSVSDYCAQHANCPVLIVKSPKEASK
ncbi:hypothetical protein J1N35_041007 [Gossypium stocksii]|uniref:UspA domain-containing protein n=1 Tax=Gossypium stocksii TaxID=47602 RepID=A0A9D3UF75_9ROSI|nr:hypothetical protein J1N35_041007 [Gossypium stocksii]